MNRSLISDAYRKLQTDLHNREDSYGTASVTMAPLVARIVEKTGPASILDYGAGKQRLATTLAKQVSNLPPIHAYDPAIPEIAHTPEPADLVACIDVLEHIEPDNLDSVIEDLARLTRKNLVASIATGPAKRILGDGRNAHLIQQPAEWWLPKLWRYFHVMDMSHPDMSRFWLRATPR
ncbi:MAG: hypothetical protein RLO01_13545 [Thalassobaculaceae bacterium]